MASSSYNFNRQGVSPDNFENQSLYNIVIDQNNFNSTASADASGGVEPRTFHDMARADQISSVNNAKRIARGNLRWRRMLQLLGKNTNFSVSNISVSPEDSTSFDENTQLTMLTFNVAFENEQFIPITGTLQGETAFGNDVDSTAIDTRTKAIRNLVAQALDGSFTEVCEHYDPTSGASDIANTELTASAVADNSTIISAITVTKKTEYNKI
tara:strand:- start:362 stop:997 length:636 start_codon:yes stop_codon:yes gene_type:complete